MKNQLKTFFQNVRFAPSATWFLSDPLVTLRATKGKNMRINYITAQYASVGDVLLIDGREFIVSGMKFLSDDTNVVIRGIAGGIGNTFIIVPDNTEFEIVREG
jgi:hypothetical protein